MEQRLISFDVLRGLAALGILIFHYYGFIYEESLYSESFLGRLGIYGVSIFYILSGYTLYYVYSNRIMLNWDSIRSFYFRRVFRIFPLLWLVVIFSFLLKSKYENIDLILNLTGLFGFIAWDRYIGTGVWSIGNELVFYSLFPFLVILFNRFKWTVLLVAVIVSVLIYFFTFLWLKNYATIEEAWYWYISPFNQFIYFFVGIIICLCIKKTPSIVYLVLALFISLVIFILIPVYGDRINLIIDVQRILFILVISTIVYSFLFIDKLNNNALYLFKPLAYLGEISYGLYLLHPIVWSCLSIISLKFINIDPLWKWILGISITLLVSHLSYQYFEKKLQIFGSKIIKSLRKDYSI